MDLTAGTTAAGKDEKECCEETGVICCACEIMSMRYNMGRQTRAEQGGERE